MTVHMWNALARCGTVLHSYVESFGLVNSFQRLLDACDCVEEVADFFLG